MKIKSDFADVYDLQHSMDHDYTWVRKQEVLDIPIIPEDFPDCRALIRYIGNTYIVHTDGSISLSPESDIVTGIFKGVAEPLALAVPIGKFLKVIINPAIRQIIGIAKIDDNPYRIHQEIEAYLKVNGRLLNGNSK